MRNRVLFAALLLELALLCGCGALPQQGPLGTVETAIREALQNDTIYFLYPSGPVYDPTGIAVYDLNTEALTQLPGLPGTDVLGLQTSEDALFYLTVDSLYRCGLDGSEQALLANTGEDGAFRNAWFFLLENTFYLCRTSLGTDAETEELKTQIVKVDMDGQVELIRETDSYYPAFAYGGCYWDGMLYYQDLKADEICKVDLSNGSIEVVSKWTRYMFATSEGIVFGDESLDYLSDGTSFCEKCSGHFIGCDGGVPYFLDSKYSTYGSINRIQDQAVQVMAEDFPWDMIAAQYIPAYQAGPYVLFYSPKDLIGDIEDKPDMVHYLYLLDGTEIKQIGYYIQDFLYS